MVLCLKGMVIKMIRGAQKKIVVVKDTKSGIFDEAYFILKNGAEPLGGLTFDDMVCEANRIISACVPEQQPAENKKKSSRLTPFLWGMAAGVIISLLTVVLTRSL